MSMYNMLFGFSSLAPILLEVLGIDRKIDNPPEIPKGTFNDWGYPIEGKIQPYIDECIKKEYWVSGRSRDIYLKDEKIILYTRNGGGNRKCYWYIFDILEKHPNYLCDYDDDFDCTYAYIEFSIPEDYKADLLKLINKEEIVNPSKKWELLFKKLDNIKGKE